MMKRIYTILIFFLAISLSSVGQEYSNAVVDKIFGKDGEQYFMFYLPNKDMLPALSKTISIDGVQGEIIYAYANRSEFARFLSYNLDYAILPHPGDFKGELNMKDEVNTREISEWDFYPTYDAYVDMMNQFASDYPDICSVFSIGNTVQGRQLLVAKISDNVNVNENEPRFLYTSSIHGDEITAYVLMLRLIDYLLSNYGINDRITNMVDGVEIWINPLANPDGTYAAGNNSVSGARRYNANWVDMNRNYPDPQAGPHPDGNQWQPETVAFMNMAEGHHFVASANFHGGAEVCNYPWDTWSRLSADDNWWEYVCREWADTVHANAPSGYMTDLDNGITNGYAWYTITGGRQDYMNYFQQCREFTCEISSTKLPSPSLLPSFWEYNYRSFLNYIEQSTYGIRGTVKDTTTNWPLEAEVKILGHEMDSSWVYSTLPVGNYHRLIDEGTYSVSFTASGYFPKTKANVQVSRLSSTILNVKLIPASGVGGLEGNQVSSTIKVFPNPVTNGKCEVSSSEAVNTCTVYAANGMERLTFRLYAKESILDLSELSAGLYILRFDTPKGPGAKRIMLY